MVACKFCKQEFLKKSTLTRHLETAKYCNTGKEKISFDCSFCSKKLASKPRLEYHTKFVFILIVLFEAERVLVSSSSFFSWLI